jgi:competence protein ComEA
VIAYTRAQLILLLGLVAAGGAGLAVGEWRRAHPEVAAALETIDRAHHGVEGDAVPAPGPVLTGLVPTPPPPTPRPAVHAAAATRPPIDLNRATAEDLTRLPGIGAVLAARIVASREADGAFASVEDLRRVPGVGATKLAALRDRVTVSR